MRNLITGLLLGACTAAVIAPATPAQALHRDTYGTLWQNNANMLWAPDFRVSSGETLGANAAAQWNAARHGSNPGFNRSSAAGPLSFDTSGACGPRNSSSGNINVGVTQVDLGGSVAGQARLCLNTSTNHYWGALVKMDDNGGGAGWYAGTGTPGATQRDKFSVMVHEFGHVTGQNYDWPDNDATGLCPTAGHGDITKRITMCGQILLGRTDQRSLATEDVDAFNYDY
jgi:hypothetical protein